MSHSLDNRLDASDTPVSCVLLSGSSGRLLGTVGIPWWRTHTATGGPEQGEKRDLMLQTGTIVSFVCKIKLSTRGTTSNRSFMRTNPQSLVLALPPACSCPITKIRASGF